MHELRPGHIRNEHRDGNMHELPVGNLFERLWLEQLVVMFKLSCWPVLGFVGFWVHGMFPRDVPVKSWHFLLRSLCCGHVPSNYWGIVGLFDVCR